ncbi:hypothetical protein ABFS83_13G171400 [Erythranthe nasuta]
MGGHLLFIYSASQAARIKRLTANLPLSIMRYNHGKKESNSTGHAPSTAEEFERVAEEKSRHGFAAHTVEKAQDGVEEATVGDSNFQSVKEAFKDDTPPPGKANFHQTGDER